MKRVLLLFTLSAALAAPALARPTADLSSPHLGAWDPASPQTVHVFWQFYANEIDDGIAAPGSNVKAYQIHTTEETGPGLGLPADIDIGIGAVYSADLTYDPTNDWFTSSVPINVNLHINNYAKPNSYKEIWVDIGGVYGAVNPILVMSPGRSYEWLFESGPSGEAEFGLRIFPNPRYEELVLEIAPMPAGLAILDWIHVDTICIPAPGTLLLVGLGTGLVGWLRSRKYL